MCISQTIKHSFNIYFVLEFLRVVQGRRRLSHVLRGCPELLGKYMEHPWIIHGCLASYPPCQSIRGFPGYSEHPWIIHGRLASYPPPSHVRVSVDSLDTLNIPGSSMDAWLPTPPMSEYPWIPWIL